MIGISFAAAIENSEGAPEVGCGFLQVSNAGQDALARNAILEQTLPKLGAHNEAVLHAKTMLQQACNVVMNDLYSSQVSETQSPRAA